MISQQHIYHTITSNSVNFQSNYYLPAGSSYKKTSSGLSTSDDTKFWWDCTIVYPDGTSETKSYSTVFNNNPASNSNINTGGIYNGSILSLPAVTRKGAVQTCLLRNKDEKCIAKFVITYEDKNEVGPHINGWVERTSTILSQKYKQLVKRDFNEYGIYETVPNNDTSKNNGNPLVDYHLNNTQQLPWAESSYGFFNGTTTDSEKLPTWSEYAFVTHVHPLSQIWPTPSKWAWTYPYIYDRTYYTSNNTKDGHIYYIDASEFQALLSMP